jgi:AcrR family transcriptional regulator
VAEERRSREERKVEIDSALVHAARHCVAVDGPDVSIHDVAREAGVSVGTVYNHFESKNDLFAAAAVRSFAEFSTWAEPVLVKITDPALRLATFGRFMTRMPDTHTEHAHVIWHTQRFVWGPKYRESEEGELERDVRCGIEMGRFDPYLMEAKVTAILGAMLHFIGLRILHPSIPAKRGDDVIEVIMGILGMKHQEAHALSHGRLPRRPPILVN